MAIPVPPPSLTDQTSFGPVSVSFGNKNYSPFDEPEIVTQRRVSVGVSEYLPIALGAVAVAIVVVVVAKGGSRFGVR